MLAIFQRKLKRLTFISGSLNYHLNVEYNAANNAASNSKGEWPAGVYDIDTVVEVEGRDGLEEGSYGKWFMRFKDFTQEDGTKRTGMGIHAGRRHKTDLAGRDGVNYATMGCIRTTSEAMDHITALWSQDPLTKLWIVD